MTTKELLVLRAFRQQPPRRMSGSDLMKTTGLWAGTIYQILLKLENEGLLESAWQNQNAPSPRRRLYAPTSQGWAALEKE